MENVTLALLIHLASYKLITVIAAAGARFPGAMLTPLMIVGAATGLLTALWLQSLFGSVPLNPSLAAVIGAGALIGGVTRLPLMAVLFALEISRQPAAVVPVALAVAAAYAGSAVFLRRR
jgi:H+/Cl- antiporter ClcA